MNNFENKYKDRNVLETISIIENFFQEKGYVLKVDFYENKDFSLFSCSINLILQNMIILHSNGKGLTKEYSYASGLAEMYERFCNKIEIFNNFLANNYYLKSSYLKNNYYYDKNEKIISFNELKNSIIIQNFFKYFFNNINDAEDYINTICDNKIIGVPFQNFNNSLDIKYFDPRILVKINRSTGMSAGNTIEEALNQGISEILERYCTNEFFKNPNLNYYFINNNNIENKKIQSIIKSFEKNNFKVIILDLAYTFFCPTVLLVLINKNDFSIYANFGTFSDFDIALERCFTEILQGTNDLLQEKLPEKNMMPYNINYWFDYHIKHGWNVKDYNYFPEEIFLNLKEKNKPSEIYQKNKSNIELNNYFKQICNNINLNLYYWDCSLSDKMSALMITSDNILCTDAWFELGKKIEHEDKTFLLSLIKNRIKITQNFIDSDFKSFKENLLMDIYTNYYIHQKDFMPQYLADIIGGDQLIPYRNDVDATTTLLEIIYLQQYNRFDKYDLIENFYFKSIKKIKFINNFINKLYFLDICQKLELKINNMDVKNKNNFNYILKTYFFDVLNDEINSDRFKKYINSLIK